MKYQQAFERKDQALVAKKDKLFKQRDYTKWELTGQDLANVSSFSNN